MAARARHPVSSTWVSVPSAPVVTADGHGMPAPYEFVDNDQSFLDSTDIVFVDAIFYRLQPPRARRKRESIPRCNRRRHLVFRFHLPIHHAQSALGFAEIFDRRKLRHHALRAALGNPRESPPDLLEWNRAGLHSRFRHGRSRRPRAFPVSKFRGHRVVSPLARSRFTVAAGRSSGAAGARFRERRISRCSAERRPEFRPKKNKRPIAQIARLTALSPNTSRKRIFESVLSAGSKNSNATSAAPSAVSILVSRESMPMPPANAMNTIPAKPHTKAFGSPRFRITFAAS